MNTPWGKSDSKITLTRGVSWVGTPSHGGFMVSKRAANLYLSAAASRRGESFGSYLAFEEDCDALIVLFELPISGLSLQPLGRVPTTESIIKSLSRWHPDYLRERGIEPDPEGLAAWEASRKQDAMRAEQHPDLIISASGDWADWVPKGRVGVITADHKRYTVPGEQYSASRTPNLLSAHTDVQPVPDTDVLAAAIFGKKVL